MRPYVCIPLRGKRGGVTLVSERYLPLVAGVPWYQSANGYAFSPKLGLMHRRLVAADPGEHVDHKNFDRLDNRHENFRCCPQSLNNKHCQKRDTPWPFKGVRKIGERWQARITIDRKPHHIGVFDTAEEAARAYDAKAREAFAHFAVCNFGG